MSEKTLRDLERAIEAHYEDELRELPDTPKGMVVDWVVGYTVHGIVEVEDKPVSGYANWYAAADTNPNGCAHLAHWVGDEISMVIGGGYDEEDD